MENFKDIIDKFVIKFSESTKDAFEKKRLTEAFEKYLYKQVEAEEKTQGGLILTSSAKEQPQVAEVVAVGPGTKDEAMELKEGDKVVFSKYGGTEIKYHGEEYTIMHQSEILAVIE